MQSKIRRKPVGIRTSRIRREPLLREPVRVMSKADFEKAEARAREREMWGGVAGIVLFAIVIMAAIVGVGAATFFKLGPAGGAKAPNFGQCYNTDEGNCVIDGSTINFRSDKVLIAGMEAPGIDGAKCDAERTRGISAAVKLADLLNGGNVTVSRSFQDPTGRTVRKVLVNGEDVGQTMISAGLAREAGNSEPDWCAPAEDDSGQN
jgi:micrococcal nuclease